MVEQEEPLMYNNSKCVLEEEKHQKEYLTVSDIKLTLESVEIHLGKLKSKTQQLKYVMKSQRESSFK